MLFQLEQLFCYKIGLLFCLCSKYFTFYFGHVCGGVCVYGHAHMHKYLCVFTDTQAHIVYNAIFVKRASWFVCLCANKLALRGSLLAKVQ